MLFITSGSRDMYKIKTFPKRSFVALFIFSLLQTSGCTVGPDYSEPHLDIKKTFYHTEKLVDFSKTLSTPEEKMPNTDDSTLNKPTGWWHYFNDPALNSLVDISLLNNSSLEAAVARLEEASALRRKSLSDFFPTIVPGIEYTNRKSSAAGTPGIPASSLRNAYFDAGAQVSWEIDIIGRLRRAYESQDALSEARYHDLQAAYQALLHEVLSNYFEAQGAHKETLLVHDLVRSNREVLRLTTLMEKDGAKSRSDVLEGKRLLAQGEIDLANIRAVRDARIASLAHLCRLPIPEIELLLMDSDKEAPLYAEELSLGSPKDILRYRPDVAAAERELAARTAEIGFEKADYWPRVSFTGLYAFQALSFSDLGKSNTETFSVMPKVSWEILDLGRVRARISAASSRAKAALADYEEIVSQAVTEVEQTVVALNATSQGELFTRTRTEAAEQLWQIAQKEYKIGSRNRTELLNAKVEYLLSRREKTQSEVKLAKAVVDLYRSTGSKLTYIPKVDKAKD
jgi:outer membrane protein, multidrug efflux system